MGNPLHAGLTTLVEGVASGTPIRVEGGGVAGTPSSAVVSVQGVAGGTPQPVTLPAETDVAQSATAAAGAMTATLAGAASKTTYLCGIIVDGLGATAASVIEVTITGTLGGTIRKKLSIPAGVTAILANPIVIMFARPVPASAVNTAIVLNVPSFGTGNTSAVCTAYGFQR